MTVRERIIEEATASFMRYGIRSISMDDIAKSLGISKKTIYQEFNSKGEILKEAINSHQQKEEAIFEIIEQKSAHAIEELVRLVHLAVENFREINPVLIHETQKYFPECWKLIEAHHSSCLYGKIKANLEKGILQGYYRNEIDVEIVTRMRIAQIISGFNETVFPMKEFDPGVVHLQILEVFMYGIVTEKGKTLLKQYLGNADLTQLLYKKTHNL